MRPPWEREGGNTPIVATAIHAGHDLRDEVRELIALDDAARLREEDPYTDFWTRIVVTRIVVNRSRFEVDLNRPRGGAVYRSTGDAWGLQVWRESPPDPVVDGSLGLYDAFYAELEMLLTALERRFGGFVVYDLHSYNHRRDGPDAPPADPSDNPEVNLGTGGLDRQRWAALVDRFVAELRAAGIGGHQLDVRENVRFEGGHLSRWVSERFPATGCCLAIDVKKFFMDEHTGEVNEETWTGLRTALAATLPGVLEEFSLARGIGGGRP